MAYYVLMMIGFDHHKDVLCHIFAIPIGIGEILDHKANRRRCPHWSVTTSHGLSQ